MSSIEERSKRSSGSDSQVSQPSFLLNVNRGGGLTSPQTGDVLLFVQSTSGEDGQLIYQASGFPSFTLDRRAVIDISANCTEQPACIIGAASRITTNTSFDGSISGQIYVDIKRTFD